MSRQNDYYLGMCVCKEKYVGRACGQCKDGFGNVKAGCRLCDCHPVGANGEGCHPDTGKQIDR